MSTAYHELLDATIQHLEGLKARGVRHIAVAPETMHALSRPASTISAPTAVKTAATELNATQTNCRVREIRNNRHASARVRNPQSAIRN